MRTKTRTKNETKSGKNLKKKKKEKDEKSPLGDLNPRPRHRSQLHEGLGIYRCLGFEMKRENHCVSSDGFSPKFGSIR